MIFFPSLTSSSHSLNPMPDPVLEMTTHYIISFSSISLCNYYFSSLQLMFSGILTLKCFNYTKISFHNFSTDLHVLNSVLTPCVVHGSPLKSLPEQTLHSPAPFVVYPRAPFVGQNSNPGEMQCNSHFVPHPLRRIWIEKDTTIQKKYVLKNQSQ